MSAPDVVADPRAHLETLRPPGYAPRRAVLALPLPPLCALLDPEGFARRRAAAVAALAAKVGGGDGPAPVVDLTGERLPERLAALWSAGVEAVWLYGAASRPTWALEVSARWPGAVHVAQDQDPLAPLLDDPRPVVQLDETGLVRVLPGVTPPPGVRALRAVTGAPESPDDFAWDPDRALGDGVGLAPPRARYAEQAPLRAAWRAHFGEPVAHALLGLVPDLQAALAPAQPQALPLPCRALCVTGTDGAGKSTHVERVARRLAARGARVEVFKLYRQGAFLQLADELSGRVGQGAPLSAFRLSRRVKLVDSLRAFAGLSARAEGLDVVLLDRWAETHQAAAEAQLAWDLTDHPALTLYPAPARRVWLTVPAGVALARIRDRAEGRSADEHPAGLVGYLQAFARLQSRGDDLVVNTQAPLDEAAAQVDGWLGSEHWGAPRPAPPPPLQSADARPLAERCAVTVGFAPGVPVLGAQVLRLRALADLARAPAEFWIEAWAAQVLLDLRCARPQRACAPLWPAAAARAWPHLSALGELARLLEHAATVDGLGALRWADWRPLAPPRAAARLCAAHARAARAEYAELEEST